MQERKIGVILTYANIFLNTAIMLFFTPFMLKILGQSEFGLFSLASSIIAYLAILDFGFGNALIVWTNKFLVKKDLKSQEILYGTIFSSYIFISFLAILIGLFLYTKIDLFFANSMNFDEINKLKIMCFVLIINLALSFIFNIYGAILNAYEKFFYIRSLAIIRTIISPICMIVLLLLGFRAIGLIVCITILNIFLFLANFIYYKKFINVKISIFKFDFSMLKIIVSYSFFIFLGIIVDQINWNFGQLVVGKFLGSKQVAIFAIAILINSTFVMLSTAISGVFLPKISQMVANGADLKTLTDEMIKIGRIQAYIIYFIFFAFVLFGRDFIEIWAGKEYLDSYFLTLFIMFSLSIPLIQNLGLSILQAKNKYAFKVISTLIGSIFMIFLALYLVEIYGYFGVAFSIGFVFFVLNCFVMNFYYHKKIKLNMLKFWINIFLILFPIFLLFLIYFFVIFAFELKGLKFFVIGFCSFSILYFFIIYNFSFNDYEKSIFRRFF